MIYQRATATTVALVRVVVFSYWAVIIGTDRLWEFATLSPLEFRGAGIFMLLPRSALGPIHNAPFLMGLQAVTFVCALLVAGGLLKRPGRLGVVALLMVYQTLIRCYAGHMFHAEMALLLVSTVVAIGPSTNALAPARAEETVCAKDFSITLVAAVGMVCFEYAFPGLVRVLKGVAFIYPENLETLITRKWLGDIATYGSSTPRPVILDYGGVLQFCYVLGTLFEVGVPLVLVFPRLRYLFAPGLVTFHVFNLLYLGPHFVENIVVVTLLFSHDTLLRTSDWVDSRWTGRRLPSEELPA